MKKIAVITPYYNEDLDLIKKANESVLNQNNKEFECEHIIIVDGYDNNNYLKNLDCFSLELKENHKDNGNTPRSFGTNLAISKKYDYIMYLDADNWFLENHTKTLFDLIKFENTIGCSYRTFFTLDCKKLDYLEDSDSLQKKHVDTSCYLIPSIFFKFINIWHLIPKPTSQWCDRIFLNNLIKNKIPLKFSEKHTVAFRSLYEVHYQNNKDKYPKNIKVNSQMNKNAYEYFSDKSNQETFNQLFGFTWKVNS
tara:strand:- start:490 stop:1245 length:756 start_codon:yes stop_codon:yes gene_type:complete